MNCEIAETTEYQIAQAQLHSERECRIAAESIRVTNRGRFQVLRPDGDLTKSPAFDTQHEAETFRHRSVPWYLVYERARAIERNQHQPFYDAILALPEMRDHRQTIQQLYSEACHRSKLAEDMRRASARSDGRRAEKLASYGDEYSAEAQAAWQAHRDACHAYNFALQALLAAAGIPVELFRSPVVVANTISTANRPWHEYRHLHENIEEAN